MNINVSLNTVITYMHGCMYVTRMSLTVGQRALGLLPLHVSGARKVPSVVMAACSSRQCGSPLLPPPPPSPHLPSHALISPLVVASDASCDQNNDKSKTDGPSPFRDGGGENQYSPEGK